MALQVPVEQIPYIQQFVALPDEKVNEMLTALSDAGMKFNTFDLAADVASRTQLPKPLVEGVIQVVASLYLTKDGQPSPLETFVDEQVRPAFRGILATNATPEQLDVVWLKFREFLLGALSLDDTVGVATKTGRVMTEHERLFVDARILTDIRPVFHPDLSEKPSAAVLVHMLRLTTRDLYGSSRVAQFFALDSNDIRTLKYLIDRAIKKEETLKSLMKGSAVNIIEPGLVF